MHSMGSSIRQPFAILYCYIFYIVYNKHYTYIYIPTSCHNLFVLVMPAGCYIRMQSGGCYFIGRAPHATWPFRLSRCRPPRCYLHCPRLLSCIAAANAAAYVAASSGVVSSKSWVPLQAASARSSFLFLQLLMVGSRIFRYNHVCCHRKGNIWKQ